MWGQPPSAVQLAICAQRPDQPSRIRRFRELRRLGERKPLPRCHSLVTVTEPAIFLMPNGCDLWPPYLCGWKPWEIWRWMSFFQRLDAAVLALLFAYVVVAAFYVTCRIRSANASTPRNDDSAPQRGRMSPAAGLGVWVKALDSVTRVAPFLGLAGVCEGIFNAFSASAAMRHTSMTGIAAIVAGTLITTAAGLIVAIPATWFYNHLQSRIAELDARVLRAPRNGSQVAQTLPLAKPFSRLPAFPLIAIPCLGFAALAFMLLHPAFFYPKGLYVRLSPLSDAEQVVITLRTAKDDPRPDVYINSKKTTWDGFGTALQNELRVRSRKAVYVGAQDQVRWAYVAEAIGLVEGLDIKVVLQPAQPAHSSIQ